MKAVSWNRNSNGLFDYESTNNTKSKLVIISDSYVVRHENLIFARSILSDVEAEDDNTVLALFQKSTHNFIMNPTISYNLKGVGFEKQWLVIRYFKDPEYLLSEGDIVRFGKVKMKVKEINGPKPCDNRRNSVHSKFIHNGGLGAPLKLRSEKYLSEYTRNERQETYSKDPACCRICLSEEDSDENPLISPCLCTGTMGVVHIVCLQNWLKSKITCNSHNNTKVYTWKSLMCELCKFQYPNNLLVSGSIVDLLSIEKPANSYIVFENTTDEIKSLYIVSFEGKKILRLGRGYESDFRISDISVSRNHASIKIKGSGLYLEDQKSKFGTLVRLKKKIELDVDTKIYVQCGKTLLKIAVTRPWSFFGCFSGCSKGRDSDEDLQRYKEITQETTPNNS